MQPAVIDGQAYELGMKFQSTQAGTINAIRFYKSSSETGTHTGRMWSSAGTQLASAVFTNETGSGWQNASLASPLSISAYTVYVVSANSNMAYVATTNGLASSLSNGPISTLADGANGVYSAPGAFPTQSYQSSNYFRDIVFTPGTTSVMSRSLNAFAAGHVPLILYDLHGRRVCQLTNAIELKKGRGNIGKGVLLAIPENRASENIRSCRAKLIVR
jgi:hypothetical protein